MMNNFLYHKNIIRVSLFVLMVISYGCADRQPGNNNYADEGEFLVYRRQSLIGEEKFSVTYSGNEITVNSLQGENERGRISGVVATLQLNKDLTPIFYENIRIANADTTNILKVEVSSNEVTIWEKKMDKVTISKPEMFFPLHSNIPAAMEMMLYHYYFSRDHHDPLRTLPRGEITISAKGIDEAIIKGKVVRLKRYVVEGINWGGRTVWLDENNRLIALVKANTQIRELIRKGYEEAMPLFIRCNVEEEMATLNTYTKSFKRPRPKFTALVGGDIVDGISGVTQKDMTLLIEDGRIKEIDKQDRVTIPANASVIDVSGKTLIPGLWEMHAHSNQVQWAPAYLAGGVTTIRDNGNEVEFATAFRNAIAEQGALGPDIMLAGMTDGAGVKGNGIIRARTPEEAIEVVEMYSNKGYEQIKIYNSIDPDILKILSSEAHKRGLTVTGHVPAAVGNARIAVESGMDMFSHRGLFLSALFPGRTDLNYRSYYLSNNEVSQQQIDNTIDFFLKHKTVLDPTIALDIIRSLPSGARVETVEPDAGRIAYELFEGKRFRNGLNPERAAQGRLDYLKALEIIGKFHKAGIPIVAGTDNVIPVFSLYLEIEAYQKYAGMTAFEALQAATIVPARAMGKHGESGSLETGKEADIAILEKNPLDDITNIRTVSAVITNGNYYDSAPLWTAADFLPHRKKPGN